MISLTFFAMGLMSLLSLLALTVLLGLWIFGGTLPATGRTTTTRLIAADRDRVWQTLKGIDQFPIWRASVARVDMKESSNGAETWTEYGATGPVSYRTVLSDGPHLLQWEITDPRDRAVRLWGIRLEAANGGTMVEIRDESVEANRLIRAMDWFRRPRRSVAARYLDDLAGQTERPAVTPSAT